MNRLNASHLYVITVQIECNFDTRILKRWHTAKSKNTPYY